jgi:hypothetical protein
MIGDLSSCNIKNKNENENMNKDVEDNKYENDRIDSKTKYDDRTIENKYEKEYW